MVLLSMTHRRITTLCGESFLRLGAAGERIEWMQRMRRRQLRPPPLAVTTLLRKRRDSERLGSQLVGGKGRKEEVVHTTRSVREAKQF